MYKIISTALLLIVMVSCKKDLPSNDQGVNIAIVNAVTGARQMVTNWSGTGPIIYQQANRILYAEYNNSYNFGRAAGEIKLGIYQFPDTLAKDAPLYNFTFDMPKGSMKTIWLCGTVSTPDNLFVNEMPPVYPIKDTVTGIRFLNLIPGGTSISVNIAGGNPGSEIANLSYKQLSDYNKYKVITNASGNLLFEFHDANTGTLLATYNATLINGKPANPWLHNHFTFAITGTPGATGEQAPRVIKVQHGL